MTRIRFETLGCKVNMYETQVLEQLFDREGFEVVQDGDAEIIVVNSCTVTAEGDRKCHQMLRRLRRENPESVLALTGCLAQAFPDAAANISVADVITGSRNRKGLLDAVRLHMSTGERVVAIQPHQPGEGFESMSSDGFGRRTRAFVKIEDGCENNCAYCIIPKARGPVRSKPPEELREELLTLARNGYREVVLSGINLSCYGREYSLRLIDAVEFACSVNGIDRVRLGSLEPNMLTDEDIARMAAQPKLCPQFHLSLQSGSDTVLQRMNRHYTSAQYLRISRALRRQFPDAAITTDMMVGFPGETDEEFAQSMSLARSVGFAKIHTFSYSPRPGTPAAEMPGQVPHEVKKRRSVALMRLGQELRVAFLQSMVGKMAEVLYENRNPDGSQTGYTRNYIPVTSIEPGDLRGEVLPTLITAVTADGCEGIVLG